MRRGRAAEAARPSFYFFRRLQGGEGQSPGVAASGLGDRCPENDLAVFAVKMPEKRHRYNPAGRRAAAGVQKKAKSAVSGSAPDTASGLLLRRAELVAAGGALDFLVAVPFHGRGTSCQREQKNQAAHQCCRFSHHAHLLPVFPMARGK